jgi:hypothetical protein
VDEISTENFFLLQSTGPEKFSSETECDTNDTRIASN